MKKKKHIVIFSHGFGVEKDSLGLFTEIAEMLSTYNIESVMFDFNEINREKKEVIVKSFSEQAKMLQSVIDKIYKENSDAIIDIIAHSQGSIMVALANLQGIRQVLSISPFFHTDIQKVIERHKKFPTSEINFNGISRRVRSDGTTSIVPPEYWSERFNTNVYNLYNKLALSKKLTIIHAGEDQIMEEPDLSKIFNAFIINIHGDHDFKGEDRKDLLKVVEEIITKK